MRPTRDDTLMAVARAYEARSTCARNQVGAVIALDGRIIMTGYNGTPAGMPHCNHTCRCGRDEIGQSLLGTLAHHSPGCPAGDPCKLAVHAEANAIAFAAQNGLCTREAELFVTLSPCYACSQLIINAGLRRVVYGRPYRDETGLDLLSAAGVHHSIYGECMG